MHAWKLTGPMDSRGTLAADLYIDDDAAGFLFACENHRWNEYSMYYERRPDIYPADDGMPVGDLLDADNLPEGCELRPVTLYFTSDPDADGLPPADATKLDPEHGWGADGDVYEVEIHD